MKLEASFHQLAVGIIALRMLLAEVDTQRSLAVIRSSPAEACINSITGVDKQSVLQPIRSPFRKSHILRAQSYTVDGYRTHHTSASTRTDIAKP